MSNATGGCIAGELSNGSNDSASGGPSMRIISG